MIARVWRSACIALWTRGDEDKLGGFVKNYCFFRFRLGICRGVFRRFDWIGIVVIRWHGCPDDDGTNCLGKHLAVGANDAINDCMLAGAGRVYRWCCDFMFITTLVGLKDANAEIDKRLST